MLLKIKCIKNYVIVLSLYDLMLTWYKKAEAKTASTNFTWLYFVFPNSFVFPFFNSNILLSVRFFGIR